VLTGTDADVIAIERWTAGGRVDPSFGRRGRASFALSGYRARLAGLARLDRGQLRLLASFSGATGDRAGLLGLRASGAPDTSLSASSIVLLAPPGGGSLEATELRVGPAGLEVRAQLRRSATSGFVEHVRVVRDRAVRATGERSGRARWIEDAFSGDEWRVATQRAPAEAPASCIRRVRETALSGGITAGVRVAHPPVALVLGTTC
jgi:hypothetical protein